MLKFRPISYSDDDLRAYKYIGTSDVAEGVFCYTKGSTLNQAKCTLWYDAKSTATVGNSPTALMRNLDINQSRCFPIYKSDPDPEDTTPTISHGDWVVGFQLKTGNEFEVYYDNTYTGFASTFTAIGSIVCVGSTGKLIPFGRAGYTYKLVGECIGTFNGWVRVRCY